MPTTVTRIAQVDLLADRILAAELLDGLFADQRDRRRLLAVRGREVPALNQADARRSRKYPGEIEFSSALTRCSGGFGGCPTTAKLACALPPPNGNGNSIADCAVTGLRLQPFEHARDRNCSCAVVVVARQRQHQLDGDELRWCGSRDRPIAIARNSSASGRRQSAAPAPARLARRPSRCACRCATCRCGRRPSGRR